MDLNYIDYDLHPAFKEYSGLTPPLGPVDISVKRFERNYVFACERGASLNAAAQTELRALLLADLESIFTYLSENGQGVDHKEFLNELKLRSIKLLHDDLRFYFRKKTVDRSAANLGLKIDLISQQHFIIDVGPETVQKILNVASAQISEFRTRVANGAFRRDQLSVNEGKLVQEIIRIVNAKYRAMGVLDSVSNYQGISTIVSGLALELSSSQAGWWKGLYPEYVSDTGANYFHYDESVGFPKSILYLSDVSLQSGPTGAVVGFLKNSKVSNLQYLLGRIVGAVGSSADSSLFSKYQNKYHMTFGSNLKREHFMRLPPELRFNSHFGFDVIPNSDLEGALIKREIKVLGKAGTGIVFDGSKLLHRGGLVEQGDRIALQIVFGAKPSLLKRVRGKLGRILG